MTDAAVGKGYEIMSRAELRRQKRQQEKRKDALRKGVPEVFLPPAPMQIANLTDQEVAKAVGVKIAVLEQWKKEQMALIRKAAMIEAQEKLDRAENFITFCNILTSLKALDGFRYARAAANHLLENYNDSIVSSEKQKARSTYEELHEKYGIEFEFDEPELNKELGFDEVDWRYEYIGQNIPISVYDKIWKDAKNTQSVFTQLAVLWELCEEFGFAKHKSGSGNMLAKFMRGTKEKYDRMEQMEHGVREITKLLKKKYDIEIAWGTEVQKTIDRFDL